MGCELFAFLSTANGYEAKGLDLDILSFGNGIIVLSTVHNGMNDLRVDAGSHTFVWNSKLQTYQ
jgi:hypothetical protein